MRRGPFHLVPFELLQIRGRDTSGLCDRFPELDFVSVESGFGYIPFLLESLDWQWKGLGAHRQYPDRLLPSEYFRRQVYSMFWFEKDALELLRMYESVVDEFQLRIISKRKNYQTFDEVMEYLVDLLFSRDPILRQHSHKRLTRAVLFYMYWNCDIGEVGDATAEQALSS